MKTLSAVLREVEQARPYSTTTPISFELLELADPGAGEIRVRIEAAGLCHSDLSVVNGDRVRPLPIALGHEAAGVVETVGEGVDDLRAGDHVVMVYVPACGACGFCRTGQPALCEAGAASNGSGELLRGGRRLRTSDGEEINHQLGVSAFAEAIVIDRSSAVRIDPDVPFDVAALFGCAMATGYGAVARTAGVRRGDSVIVLGLGGVGLAAVIAANALGASDILAIDPVGAKRDRAGELGATRVAAPDAAAGLVADDGRADWVFEAVGAAPVIEQAYALTKRGGTTVSMGLPHPEVRISLPALSIVAESRTLKGSYMGSTRPQEDIPEMARLWREGRLPVEKLISARRPLDELNEALEALADGTAIRQILVPDGRALDV
jgi:alcohol dehydrogenase